VSLDFLRQRVVLDVYSLPGLMSHLESLRALYWGLYFLLYLLVTFVKLFFLAVLLPFMQMTANVPEALCLFNSYLLDVFDCTLLCLKRRNLMSLVVCLQYSLLQLS